MEPAAELVVDTARGHLVQGQLDDGLVKARPFREPKQECEVSRARELGCDSEPAVL